MHYIQHIATLLTPKTIRCIEESDTTILEYILHHPDNKVSNLHSHSILPKYPHSKVFLIQSE